MPSSINPAVQSWFKEEAERLKAAHPPCHMPTCPRPSAQPNAYCLRCYSAWLERDLDYYWEMVEEHGHPEGWHIIRVEDMACIWEDQRWKRT